MESSPSWLLDSNSSDGEKDEAEERELRTKENMFGT